MFDKPFNKSFCFMEKASKTPWKIGQRDFSMKLNGERTTDHKLLIKKCHVCGHLNEAAQEPKRCNHCNKSFLPSNYFSKVHSKSGKDYDNLFLNAYELNEQDMVKGIHVLW